MILEDVFASKVTSPRVAVLEPSIFSQTSPQMQTHNTIHAYMHFLNQMLPPINSQTFSQPITQMQQVAIEPQGLGHCLMQSPFQSSSYGLGYLSIFSPHCVVVEHHNACGSLLSVAMVATLNSRIATFAQSKKQSHNSFDLRAHVTPNSWFDWGFSNW